MPRDHFRRASSAISAPRWKHFDADHEEAGGREGGRERKIGKAVSEGLRIIDINILGVFRIYISRVSAISFAWRI